MAGTRRYLWTQRVKYPNREDMRSKVSSRNWRKVYSMVRGIPRGQLDNVPALTREVVEGFFRQTYDKRHVT